MRGSIHISNRSEINVPTTVRSPSRRMMVDASSMSCDSRDRSSSGPTVGRLSTTEMITDPDQKIGRPRQLFTGAARRDVKMAGKR